MLFSRLVKEKKLPLPLIRFLLNISVAIFHLETQQTRRSILPTPHSIYVSIFYIFVVSVLLASAIGPTPKYPSVLYTPDLLDNYCNLDAMISSIIPIILCLFEIK